MNKTLSILIGASALAAVGSFTFPLLSANAFTLDATGLGSFTAPDGVIWNHVSGSPPAGSGVFDPFLRIQNTPNEAGYNTDYRGGTPPKKAGADNDAKIDPFTHSLLFSSVPLVTIGSSQYYQFLLDLNEPNGGQQPKIDVTKLQVYLGDKPDLYNFISSPIQNGTATKYYDLGSGNKVLLDDQSSGSGKYDYVVSIPSSFFGAADPSKPYLYLVNGFDRSAGGFEEWSVQKSNGTPVPEPLTILGSGIALGFGGFLKRKAKQDKQG